MPHRRPTMTVLVPNFGPFLDDWRHLVDIAVAADRAGVDRIQVVDHLVMGPDPQSYPWGRFPTGSDGPWLEPLAVLSAMAGATERVRLSTGILIAPLRSAAVLAKTTATIDVLSRGRLDLGVGAGWQEAEYDAVGLPFAERGRLLDEVLEACRALWLQAPATIRVDGRDVPDVWCRPAPLGPAGVPLWIGGVLHRRNLARIVAHGSGWIPIMGASLDDLAQGWATIEQALTEAGRDPSGFDVQGRLPVVRGEDGPDLERTMEALPEVLAAGATDLLVPLGALAPDPLDAGDHLERAATAFAEAVA